MKDYYPFLFVLSATLLIIAGLAIVDPVPEVAAKVHPTYKSMLQSSNSQASSPAVKYLGFAFGLAIIGIFGASFYWGSRRAKDSGFRHRDLMIGMILYLITYSGLVFSSWKYDQMEAPLWGDLPIPTAWMLYGIWFMPVFFIVLYVYGFKDHVLSPEDEASFHKILAERAARQQSNE